MRLIFLHGLGQGADSWQEVYRLLSDDHKVICLNLFEKGHLPRHLDDWQEKLNQLLDESDDTVVIGLSLGAVLALSLLKRSHPHLKGIVACAGQYRFARNSAFKLQVALFRLLPQRFFKQHGMDKANVLAFYKGIADLDLTDVLRKTTLPCQLVCGDRDRFNRKASQDLLRLMPNSRLEILKQTGHESNKENPKDLASVIKIFLESIAHEK